jgi:flagellar biosynthesis protein FlhF
MSDELAHELVENAYAHTLPLAPRAGLLHAVRAALTQRMPAACPLPLTGAAIAVVGPGGAGRTTCCSALLSAYRRGSTLPARYATLVRPPRGEDLLMILSPDVLRPAPAGSAPALGALARARREGVVIIDTPAVSPADPGGIHDLGRTLARIRPDRIVLALPATIGAAAAGQLVRALEPLGINTVAVTHAEETDQVGVVAEVACTFALAPEYALHRRPGGGWRLRRMGPSELAEALLS